MSEPKTGMHHSRVAPMEGRGGITVIDEEVTVKRCLQNLTRDFEQAAAELYAAIDAKKAEAVQSRETKSRPVKRVSEVTVKSQYEVQFPNGATKKEANDWAKANGYSTGMVREIHKTKAHRPRGRPRKGQ